MNTSSARVPAHSAIPAGSADPLIRVSVQCPEQLFNSIDPSPFHERDLDEKAERFILNWARDVNQAGDLQLEVTVTAPGASSDGESDITEAVHQQFQRMHDTASRELRQLLRNGRLSAVIGLAFLIGSVILGDLVGRWLGQSGTAHVIQEGLQLLGWVSTWTPIEIFLYRWWPLARDRKLYKRLSRMPVRVRRPPAAEMNRPLAGLQRNTG